MLADHMPMDKIVHWHDNDSLTVFKERDFKAFYELVSFDFRIHERKQEEPLIEIRGTTLIDSLCL